MASPSLHCVGVGFVASLLVAAIAGTAGCATGADEVRANGARRGTIVQFYTPATVASDLPTCLAGLPRGDLARRHFVRVDYKHVRHLFSTIAEVSDTAALRSGQQVEIWLDDCEHGHFGRIGKTLNTNGTDTAP